jgi:hypothetical protein
MKTKSFQEYIEKRLNKEDLAEVYAQAGLEVKNLRSLERYIDPVLSDMNDYEE